MADSSQAWWVAVAAALPGLALAWWNRRSDSADKREEREARELDALRDRLTAREAALFKRVEDERDRLHRELEDAERQRDRGWSLARFWHHEAHRLRHLLRNARAQRDGALARHGEPKPADENGDKLPPFEHPEGERT